MIKKEGGCIDERHGTVWVCLQYDDKEKSTFVEIKDTKEGVRLCMNGKTGKGAKAYYDKLNNYFFGYEQV